MRLLVTGASGFIGAFVVRLAVEAGHEVTALVRSSSKTDRIDGLPWRRAVGDVRDAAAVAAALSGCDAVVHLAAVVAWDRIDSPEVSDIIVQGTQVVLRAARTAGERAGHIRRSPRVVVVSSVAATGGTDDPRVVNEETASSAIPAALVYGRAKRAAEVLASDAIAIGQPIIVARPTEVYGPEDRDLVTARTLIDFANGFPVLICRGGTSVVHVQDVAQALLRMTTHGRLGQTYLLGGDNLNWRQLAELCLTLLGRRAPIVAAPNGLLRAVTRVGLHLGVPLPYNARAIPYATRFWFVDTWKARDELGITFRGARETIAPALAWLNRTGRIRTARHITV